MPLEAGTLHHSCMSVSRRRRRKPAIIRVQMHHVHVVRNSGRRTDFPEKAFSIPLTDWRRLKKSRTEIRPIKDRVRCPPLLLRTASKSQVPGASVIFPLPRLPSTSSLPRTFLVLIPSLLLLKRPHRLHPRLLYFKNKTVDSLGNWKN